MARIIVMGAGLGGVACAYEMKKKVGRDHRVTLVGSNPYFEFTPSNPWLMVGWRTAPDTRVELAKHLAAKDVEWVPQMVGSIDAPGSRLTLADGSTLDYDYLVIALGAVVNYSYSTHVGEFYIIPLDSANDAVYTVPYDLDGVYSPACFGFTTYREGRGRTTLPPMPDESGDYPIAHPPRFTPPEYWATCRTAVNRFAPKACVSAGREWRPGWNCWATILS